MAHPILKYFAAGHLTPGPLQEASSLCGTLARDLDAILPDGPEKSTALRKLL